MKIPPPLIAHIQIPQPCKADWTGMDLKDEGRFCHQCQKAVIDFSHFSDAQLIHYFETHQNTSVCGKIPISKLNQPIEIPAPKKQLSGWWLLSALVGVTLTPAIAVAKNAQHENNISPCFSEAQNAIVKDTSHHHIKGQVIDKNTKEAIAFAIIQANQLGLNCVTNVDGCFDLKIPDSLVNTTSIEIMVTFIGYETVHTQIEVEQFRSSEMASINVEMEMASSSIIGEIIYVRAPWHKRLKYRVKRLFKRSI